MKLHALEDLFLEQVRDIYDAERQLVKALPKMADSAASEELRTAFAEHLDQTRGHVDRLEQVFELLGKKARGKICEAMEGMVDEGAEIIDADGEPMVRDAGLIAAAQRVEHYEIAAYGTAKTLAGELDLNEAKDLLDQTLDEESNADKLLTKIATGGMLKTGINQKAS